MKIKKQLKKYLSNEQYTTFAINKSKLKQLKNYIIEINEELDFDRITEVMFKLNWQWANIGRVPNKNDLKKLVIELSILAFYYEHTFKVSPHSVSTGGLKATCHSFDDSFTLNVEFILTSWEATCD